jgi:hypothetical protein
MEDAQWQCHPLNNHPGQEPIEIQLQTQVSCHGMQELQQNKLFPIQHPDIQSL